MTIKTMSGDKREPDQIEDDKNRLRSLKTDFIQVMLAAVKYRTDEEAYDNCVAAEQAFEDLISDDWLHLCDEDHDYEHLPRSLHLRKWEHECKEKDKRKAIISDGVKQ